MRAHQRIHVQSQAGTERVAARLARAARGGDVFALTGPLGAGKTTFVKAFAKALGVRATVTSPTFLLMRIYNVKREARNVKRLVHVDAYRIKHAQELIDIGLLDFLGKPDTVTLVEWAEKVKGILPRTGRRSVRIRLGETSEERTFVLS